MNDNIKRIVLASIVSFAVVMVYTRFILPTPQQMQVQNVQVQGQDQNLQVENKNNGQNAKIADASNDNLIPSDVTVKSPTVKNESIPQQEALEAVSKTFITPLFEMRISELGGRIISYKLRKYSNSLNSQDLVELIDITENSYYPLAAIYNGKRDDFVKYDITIESDGVEKITDKTFSIKKDAKIILTGKDQDNETVKKEISIFPDSYLFDVALPLPQTNDNAWIEWEHRAITDLDTYNEYSVLHLTDESKVKKIKFKELQDPIKDLGKNLWISAGFKYFSTALIPLSSTDNTRFGAANNNFVMQGRLSSKDKNIKIYVGPKDQDILKDAGYNLEKSIDLGFFSIIAYPLLSLIKIFYNFLGNYGLAIVLLTLIIKMIFLPLTSASMKSMKKMQDLQPKMKELRERIKNPNELNTAIMDLYKKNNVNPMGGCIPMLIQIPVFFGLYVALLNSISLRHSGFALWITDLSSPEKLQMFGVGVPVMILLMGISMFVQQLTTPSAMDPAQKKAMLITPIIFTGIFLIHPFPSGLVLYWLTNNLISIVQQKVLKSEGDKISPFKSTLIGSGVIFGLAYILTLF